MKIKPILKWVGGKTQILDKIIESFPKEIGDYHEPFIGGGSVLLKLLESNEIDVKGNVYAYDLNESLVNVYKNIQKTPEDVYTEVSELIKDSNDNDKEEYYYTIRKIWNSFTQKEKNTTKGTAFFIYLNKTCFRGLYRVGPNGFNVPYGHYKNPEIINKENLMSVSRLIKHVVFKVSDFKETLIDIKVKNDTFVYLDPPYVPETKTSFVKYNLNGFSDDDHKELFELVKNLKCSFVMSNSNTDLVLESFKGFSIKKIDCKRSINSKNPSQMTKEVIIIQLNNVSK
jgi:DNA adenine methylase